MMNNGRRRYGRNDDSAATSVKTKRKQMIFFTHVLERMLM